jgi:hypothetical protein
LMNTVKNTPLGRISADALSSTKAVIIEVQCHAAIWYEKPLWFLEKLCIIQNFIKETISSQCPSRNETILVQFLYKYEPIICLHVAFKICMHVHSPQEWLLPAIAEWHCHFRLSLFCWPPIDKWR